MSENDESRDGGWEDLFAPLEDPAPRPAGADAVPGPFDPAALYSALQEDLASEAEPAVSPPPAVPPVPAVPVSGTPQAAAPAAADASTGLTRRELREQRAALQSGPTPTIDAAPHVPASIPAVPAPSPAVPDPVPAVPDPVPAVPGPEDALADTDTPRLPEPFRVPAREPEAVPWDPAPELQPEPELPAVVPTVPVSYDTVAAADPPAIPPIDGAFPMRLDPPPPGRRGGRSVRWLAWFIPVVLVVAAVVGGGVYLWANHEDKIRQILGLEIPDDYSGTGNGEQVVVTIKQGDSGSDIALALYQAGVTMSWRSFNDLATKLSHSTDCANPDPNNGCWPVIQFGNYNLQKEMSAKAALAAIQDPANKVTNNIVIPEGSTLTQTLDIISATTGIPVDDLKAAAADPAQFGAANPANSLEGYLFPDTYQLDGTETATSVLQRLVDETFQKLDALGVPADQRHAFLTGASIVQKESGPVAGDAAKVARVFQNRLAQGMKLQSDATVAYGAGNTTSIWNTSAQLKDANNPYNTYVQAGLPIGPISAPGAVALDAWAHPADGDWLFFVPVNLKTGETHFSTTNAEHEQYVQQLVQWCEASAENAAYCK